MYSFGSVRRLRKILDSMTVTFDNQTRVTSGVHFTNNFSITIQMWWKFHFALIPILIKWSLHYLAHGTTAGLSWHMPNFVVIWLSVIESELKWNFHQIWIVMEKSLVKWAPGLGLLYSVYLDTLWENTSPLWRESICYRWIPLIYDQWCGALEFPKFET